VISTSKGHFTATIDTVGSIDHNPAMSFAFERRACGILMHPTSLPGPAFSGDLGPSAYEFVDFLHSAAQTWWQMLPVNPPGAAPGYSPYSALSAMAGSPWLISLELLTKEGLLEKAELRAPGGMPRGRHTRIDFAEDHDYRMRLLRKAYERWGRAGGFKRKGFSEYCRTHSSWLDEWCLYAALRDAHGGKPWLEWRRDLSLCEPDALKDARFRLADAVRFQQFLQFTFDRQWRALKAYANTRGVGLIGDIPIFVAHDSADVWAHRKLFLLEPDGFPATVSGYPPDAFNRNGQKWDHPHYNWPEHRKARFSWWVKRFEETFRLFDGVRIDHFLGFHRTWHVPGRAKNARKGHWVPTPGMELFTAVIRKLGSIPIIAEDLGQLTPESAQMRDHFGFPGMRVMQFGFGGGDYHLPHSAPRRSVLYTGTHDNQTIVGWYKSLKKDRARRRGEFARVHDYLNVNGSADVHWPMIRSAMSSHCDTVIFPTQDLLGLDDSARMNVPGTVRGNWDWRLADARALRGTAGTLRRLVELYGRDPSKAGG
jgi:4-alpha-glucanotransferase